MVNVAEHGATQWPDGGLAGSSQGREGASFGEDSLSLTAGATRSSGISMPAIAAHTSVSGCPLGDALSPCGIAQRLPAVSAS
jgi:hypothetical protein